MEDMGSLLLTEFSVDVTVADARWHHISRPWVKVLVSLHIGQILGLELRLDHAASSLTSEPAYSWGEALCLQSQDIVVARSDFDLRRIGPMNKGRSLHSSDLSASKIRMSFLYLFLEWPASAYGFGSAMNTQSLIYSILIELIEKAINEFNKFKWKCIYSDLS